MPKEKATENALYIYLYIYAILRVVSCTYEQQSERHQRPQDSYLKSTTKIRINKLFAQLIK